MWFFISWFVLWWYFVPALITVPLSWLAMMVARWNKRVANGYDDEDVIRSLRMTHKHSLRFFWMPVLNIVNISIIIWDILRGCVATLVILLFN